MDHAELKKAPFQNKKNFGMVDACFLLLSLITYLVDSLTDILVAVQYVQMEEYLWATMTSIFILFPSVIIQIFSARWYTADGKMRGAACWLIHIFQLQPLERYLFVLIAGVEARNTGSAEAIENYYYQQNDVCMLRLFEAFLESAPQLTLQIYIMLCTNNATWLTVTSASVSLIALGWAVASYTHALRQAYRDEYKVYWPGLGLQTIWHICMAAARVLAIIAFANVFKAWVFLVIGVHWAVMTVWVMVQKTDFCPTCLEEHLFDCVVGVIYCFCFFNLKEGQTRWRMTAFYTIMLAENLILVGVWYPFRTPGEWFNLLIMVTVFAGFAMGLCCMMLYYRFCHPSGPMYCCSTLPSSSSKTLSSTPQVGRKHGLNPVKVQMQVEMIPKSLSSCSLSRRTLLKQASQQLVRFKEISTPSQLSPIKACNTPIRNIYTDCTLELDDASVYRHYSVDASACMQNLPGNTIDLSDLSKECFLYDITEEAPTKDASLCTGYYTEKSSVKSEVKDIGDMSARSTHFDEELPLHPAFGEDLEIKFIDQSSLRFSQISRDSIIFSGDNNESQSSSVLSPPSRPGCDASSLEDTTGRQGCDSEGVTDSAVDSTLDLTQFGLECSSFSDEKDPFVRECNSSLDLTQFGQECDSFYESAGDLASPDLLAGHENNKKAMKTNYSDNIHYSKLLY